MIECGKKELMIYLLQSSRIPENYGQRARKTMFDIDRKFLAIASHVSIKHHLIIKESIHIRNDIQINSSIVPRCIIDLNTQHRTGCSLKSSRILSTNLICTLITAPKPRSPHQPLLLQQLKNKRNNHEREGVVRRNIMRITYHHPICPLINPPP